MGLTSRNKSGNLFAGSRLNVPGQGIYNVKKSEGDKLGVKTSFSPRPSPTPSPTPTPSPLPDLCYLSSNLLEFMMTENDVYIVVECPTPTPTPSSTPVPTPTPSATPTGCYFITQYEYDIITEYGSNIEVC